MPRWSPALIMAFTDAMRIECHAVESTCRVLREQGCRVAARNYRVCGVAVHRRPGPCPTRCWVPSWHREHPEGHGLSRSSGNPIRCPQPAGAAHSRTKSVTVHSTSAPVTVLRPKSRWAGKP
jgi:hypothetical protein